MTNTHEPAATLQEPLEAAAITLEAFTERYPMDARLMLKLLYLCDNKSAQAMVLWDALKQHHSVKKTDVWLPQSTSAYLNRYSNFTVGSIHRAITDLSESGYLVLYASAPNTKRKIKVHFNNLFAELEQMEVQFKKFPGLEL